MDLRNRRPSAGVVVGMTALVVALSGTAYGQDAVTAAARLVTNGNLASNAVTSAKVKDGSLLAKDFKKGQLPAGATGATGATGAKGAQGPQGLQGPQGPAGTPNGYTKTEADGRFLATGGKAADANTLDGVDSSGFTKGNGFISSDYASTTVGNTVTLLTAGNSRLRMDCTAGPTVDVVLDALNGASFTSGWVQNPGTATLNYAGPFTASLASVGTTAGRTVTAGVVNSALIGALTTTYTVEMYVSGTTCRAAAQAVTRDSSLNLVLLP